MTLKTTAERRASLRQHVRHRTMTLSVLDNIDILVDDVDTLLAENEALRLRLTREKTSHLVTVIASILHLRGKADLYCKALDEICEFQDASGLSVGGDPGGVTPEHLRKLLRLLEGIAEAAKRDDRQTLSELLRQHESIPEV